MNQKTSDSDTYTHSSGQQILLGDMFISVDSRPINHGRLYVVTSLFIVRKRWKIKLLDIAASREHTCYAHDMIDNRWMNKVT